MQNKIKGEQWSQSCADLLNDTFEESREEYRSRVRIFKTQRTK